MLGLCVVLRYTRFNLDLGESILIMSNEDFERKVEFIVSWQAQFTVDLDQLRETQSATAQTVSQMGDVVTRLAYVTNEGFKQLSQKIDVLVDSQIRSDEASNRRLEALDRRLEALAASQDRTETSLEELIRSLTKGRNGTDT